MKRYAAVFFVLLAGAGVLFAANTAQDKEIDKKVSKILKNMTLQEKIGQMFQLNSENAEDVCALLKEGLVGSVLNNVNPQSINAMQKCAMEAKNSIPLIVGRDIIHGFKTIFPIPLGQAASFDAALVEKGARVAAIEASSVGVNWTFAPMLDISRDSRWGRIAESFGEDTYLTSVLGAASVKGYQTDNPSGKTAIAATAKHFVGYGAAEGGRDYNTADIPLRTLRNIYLPPFKAAIDAGALTIMNSFNEIDGVPSTANKLLLRDILRGEWKFDGMVVSDWTSPDEMVLHGFARDLNHAVELAVNAGMDMAMMTDHFTSRLEQLVDDKKVSVKTINNAVRNILKLKMKLGLFDNPYVDASAESPFYAPEHLAAAKQAALESVILLKNDNNTLPLKNIKKIAVIGPLADAPHDQLGTWIFDGDKAHTVTPLTALKELEGVEIAYEPVLAYSREKNKGNFSAAVKAAKASDAAVVFLGEESLMSGEANSLADINLFGVQSELLAEVKKAGKPVVLVVMAGRALTLARDLQNADAILYAFHPGTMGGPAIADLLTGKTSPSGKTPVTFLKTVGQVPLYYNHHNSGRPGYENTLIDEIPVEVVQHSVGNSSRYIDAGVKPLFPFGFGLSYAEFEYSNLKLSSDSMNIKGKITVSADIKNISEKYDGVEIVQLYTQTVTGSVNRPVKELKGFQRVALKAGETKRVTFDITPEMLAFYGLDMKFKAEEGAHNVWIAASSADETLKAQFTLTAK